MNISKLEAVRYLRHKVCEIEHRLAGRRIGETGRDYGKPAIEELIHKLDGAIRFAYAMEIFAMGDDEYVELVAATVRAQTELKEKV